MSDKLDITVTDEGAGVSADALRTLLNHTLAYLEAEPGGGEGVTWRVTRVSMNSPFSITFEREVLDDMPEPAERPGERLARLFAVLRSGELPGNDVPLPQARRAAAIAQIAESDRTVALKAERGRRINISPDWGSALKKWIRQRAAHQVLEDQHYSVAGRLEGVDVHGKKSEFYVYDPLTDQKMRCLFSDEFLERVKQSLGERVEVSGWTKFNAADEPLRMQVESLRVIRVRSFLSRLKDAQRRGVMNLTGGLSVEDALREVRDAGT